MVAQLANHCLLEKHEAGSISLILDQEGEELRSEQAESDLHLALESLFKEPVKLVMNTAKITAETPDKRHTRMANERQEDAEQKIANDPFVQELQTELGATIVSGSIRIKKDNS